MLDGTPEQQQAQEKMRQWMEQHQPVLDAPDQVGGVVKAGATLENLIAAAGAGQFALSPDVGDAINNQLAEVQRQVGEVQRGVQFAATDPQFGGGYAEQVGAFVKGVAAGQAGSAEEILTKFAQELEQLKDAVARSMASYRATDEDSASDITGAGGQG